MKKNWMQIATLCLCGILLVVTVGQGRRLENYQRQMEKMENKIENLDRSVSEEIRSISNSVERELEKANRVVLDYVFEPVGLSKEDHMLLADVSLTLKEWHEDTSVELFVEAGGGTYYLPAAKEGSGGFRGQLSLPVENSGEVRLNALIFDGGLTKREFLGGWSDISMLLPLQFGGAGWGGPSYKKGVLSSQYHFTIRGLEGMPETVQEPEFQIYKNGVLTQTLGAVIDPHASSGDGLCYTVDTEDNRWSLECEVGDVVAIHFLCRDEYGLGYDFPFQTWIVEGEGTEHQPAVSEVSGGYEPMLYWT